MTLPASTTVNADNPWPGLLAYHEADQPFFHGREAETDELLRLVLRETLTILFGLSGIGKSSLLQAGLFPRLRRQQMLPVYIRLGFSPDQPGLGAQVRQAISAAAAQAGVQAPEGNSQKETLWEYFHRREADFWNERNRLVLPLLVFDQFEEIFTLGRQDAIQAQASELFLGELGDLIEGRPPAALKAHLDQHPEDAANFSFSRHYYKVLLSLREDFIPELEGLRERIPAVIHNRMRLQRMNGAAALQVVAHPQHLIEPAVAEQVVRFVAAAPAGMPLRQLELEPALLSVVCRELNNKRRQMREPRITEDLLEGSQEEILGGFYERSIRDLAPQVRAFVEEKLLTVSGYRDSIALENALSTPGVTRKDIDLLMNRRLLRKEERTGMQRLELTHDLLTGVIAASRDRRRLLEAEQHHQKEAAEQERQQRLEERAQSARRFRWLSVALALLSLLALTAFYWAREQKKQADRQRRLAIRAEREASQAEIKSRQRLRRIAESVRLRQLVLSRDTAALNRAFATTLVDTLIKFRASATAYPYKAIGGAPTYKFRMFPEEGSIPGGFKSIALITYIMDHPTFLNPLISAGPDTEFTGTYDGVGCLDRVIAVIEYANVNKPVAIARFDMCARLEMEE